MTVKMFSTVLFVLFLGISSIDAEAVTEELPPGEFP